MKAQDNNVPFSVLFQMLIEQFLDFRQMCFPFAFTRCHVDPGSVNQPKIAWGYPAEIPRVQKDVPPGKISWRTPLPICADTCWDNTACSNSVRPQYIIVQKLYLPYWSSLAAAIQNKRAEFRMRCPTGSQRPRSNRSLTTAIQVTPIGTSLCVTRGVGTPCCLFVKRK